MPPFWPTLAKLLVVLCLVLVQAPQPCRGDAHGGACSMTSCACTTACTCQAEHQEARTLATKLASVPSCCKVEGGLATASEALLAACHGPEAPRHFAPPGQGDPAVAPAANQSWRPDRARRPDTRYVGLAAGRAPPPAARPPWTPA